MKERGTSAVCLELTAVMERGVSCQGAAEREQIVMVQIG
jgi:hypothetical protein